MKPMICLWEKKIQYYGSLNTSKDKILGEIPRRTTKILHALLFLLFSSSSTPLKFLQ